MGTNDHKAGRNSYGQKDRTSRVRWLLGALGLLWAGGVVLRSFRGDKRDVLEPTRPAGAAPLSRFGEEPRPPAQPLRAHETSDANAKWIFGIVLFLFLSGLAIHALLTWILKGLDRRPATSDRWRPVLATAQVAPPRPPFPTLQVSPPLDLDEIRAREEKELHSYGWINRTAGIVRVPIERATELLLQGGFPTRSDSRPEQEGPSSYELIQQRLRNRQPETEGQK